MHTVLILLLLELTVIAGNFCDDDYDDHYTAFRRLRVPSGRHEHFVADSTVCAGWPQRSLHQRSRQFIQAVKSLIRLGASNRSLTAYLIAEKSILIRGFVLSQVECRHRVMRVCAVFISRIHMGNHHFCSLFLVYFASSTAHPLPIIFSLALNPPSSFFFPLCPHRLTFTWQECCSLCL